MVGRALEILNNRPGDGFDAFGRLLHESWQIKRTLSTKITNSRIDEIYLAAKRAGAIGGKVLGAGGGGFMLFLSGPNGSLHSRRR
jgi:D-glycero-alpha-D-manno-heptose-7-phosphate kinase